MAVNAGYDLSASAIFDANLTVLAASLLLFQFGTGPIKGFAVTLTLGNLFSMFTATVATKILTGTWLGARARTTRTWRPLDMFRLPRLDWTAKRHRFFAVSALIVILSATSLAVRGLNYGIDFTGALQVTYEPAKPDHVAARLERAGPSDADIQAFAGTTSYAIRPEGRSTLTPSRSSASWRRCRRPIRRTGADGPQEYVGPAVGAR
jgi:SecD/SecF fusion protein